MRKNRVLLLVLFFAIVLAPLAAHAEEELFDTKAAAEHIEKGIAQLKAKNYDDAIKEFDESATIAPEAEAYYYLGYAYYLKGRNKDDGNRQKSRENFEKAYEIDPNFTPTRYKPSQPAPALGHPTRGEAQAPAEIEKPAPSAPMENSQPAKSDEQTAPQPTSPKDQPRQ